MATKGDSPKLTPAERLARKRAAARLRQQRCRARKRQAMLEKKRGEIVRQRCTQDQLTPAVPMRKIQHHTPPPFPAYISTLPTTAPASSWTIMRGKGQPHQQLHRTPSGPIYNCVSFDSQKSLEDAQLNRAKALSSPPQSPPQEPKIVITPTRTPPVEKPAVVVKNVPEDKVEDALVPEEEAAIAAMLSLKSGSTTPSEKRQDESKPSSPRNSPPPREVVIAHKPLGPEYRPPLVRRTLPRRFEGYNYGPPIKMPLHSRRAHVPPRYYRTAVPPHPHYARCYYPPPPAPRYVSYDYE